MKELFRKSTAVILTAAMLISAASCSGGKSNDKPADTSVKESGTAKEETSGSSEETRTEAAETENTVPAAASTSYEATDANVKYSGRNFYDGDVLWLAHSASAVEFTFSGTKLSVEIKGDGAANGDSDSQARFAVYVNGERKLDEMVDSEAKTYDIISADTKEEDTVKIIKLSESTSSTFGIQAINADGEIAPTPANDLKIEFIGDSITCGYGVDDEDKNHHFSTKTEDATRAYAYKTADALDADYSIISYSGHGIISGYTDNGKINTAALVPPVYEHYAKTYGSANGYWDVETEWDFSSFVPDYIVINLGTNDNSYISNQKDIMLEFIAGYVEFIKQVRKDNPDSYILCTIGTMGGNSGVKKAVNQYIDETGDNKVSFMQFAQQNEGKNGLAADWHPTEATHTLSAEKLVEELKKLIDGDTSEAAAA